MIQQENFKDKCIHTHIQNQSRTKRESSPVGALTLYGILGTTEEGLRNSYQGWNKALLLLFSPKPCPTLCDPRDYSLPGSSVHGIFHTRLLEGVAISFSGGSFQLRDGTRGSCKVPALAGEFFFFLNHGWEARNKAQISAKNQSTDSNLGKEPTFYTYLYFTVSSLKYFL